jgi:hypothetical protein
VMTMMMRMMVVDSTGVRGQSAEGYSASSTTEEC